MNIFKKIYCRIYQGIFKAMIGILPYRVPRLLQTDAELAQVLASADKRRALIVTDKSVHELGLCDGVKARLDEAAIAYEVYDGTVPNPTTDNVAEAVGVYRDRQCDCVIAVGGGSAMDCAKGVGACIARPNKTLSQMKGLLKVRKRLPLLIAIPTTAGTGSETTVAAVITDSETRHKYAINDFSLIPDYALLDSTLTLGLPPRVTAATGMDALTHAVEAYIGRSTTRETRANALNAAKIIFARLPQVYRDGTDAAARGDMLYASFLAGAAFTKSYVGYVHAIAHALGGKYNVAHGLANAVILPYVLKSYGKSAYARLNSMGAYAKLYDPDLPAQEGARLLIERVESMNRDMGIPEHLDCIAEADIPALAATAEKEANPLYPVPKLFTARQLEAIIRQVAGLD